MNNRVAKYFEQDNYRDIRQKLDDAEQMGYIAGYNYAMEIAPKQAKVTLGIAFVAGILVCYFMQWM